MQHGPQYGIDRRKHETLRLPSWLILLLWGIFITMAGIVYRAGQLVQRVDDIQVEMRQIRAEVEQLKRRP